MERKYDMKHEFTVKSAYRVALRLNQREVTEHSRASWGGKQIVENDLGPQGSTKSFMWRAVSNILPTRDKLYRRRVDVYRSCEFCRQHPR